MVHLLFPATAVTALVPCLFFALLNLSDGSGAPDPLVSACVPDDYSPASAAAGVAVEASLLPAVASLGVGVDAANANPNDVLRDGYSGTVPLSTGGTDMNLATISATVEVHGFGDCQNAFGLYKNDFNWCGAAIGDCAMIGNVREASLDYGRCLMDPQPAGSESNYALNDYGIVTMELSYPTTIETSFIISDMSGHKYAREAGTILGIAEDGSLVLPSTITPSAAHYGNIAELSAVDGTSVGLAMGGASALIPVYEWVGTTGDERDEVYGPHADSPNDDPLGQITFTFDKEVKTFAFLFSYAESINQDVPTKTWVNGEEDIQLGFTVYAGDVSCSAPCEEVTSTGGVILNIADPEANELCDTYVRDVSFWQYAPSGPTTCIEKYYEKWTSKGEDPVGGQIPCKKDTNKRLVSNE